MPKFYYLYNGYTPNTAPTNRMLAYIKGLSELKVETNLIFFFADKKKSKISNYFSNITIEYYWDKWFYIDNKYIKYVYYVFSVIHFLCRVKKGDTVYMYNMADLFHFLLKKKKVSVFLEKTEYPSMYPLGSHIYRPKIGEYLKDCSKATGIITVSTSLRDFFIENGVLENNIRIVNMIVDEHRFDNVKPAKFDKPYFGYCGTVSTFKDGVDNLIVSFSHVYKKYPELTLRIAGNFADENDKKKLLDLVNKLGITDAVIFMGVVSAFDIPSFLAGAVSVVLSRPDNIQAKYGFPGKLGEYLLSEAPSIVTKVGDIPLFIKDGENGLLVQPDDTEAFAQKMIWVIEHKDAAKQIGRNGKDLALRKFNYYTESRKLKAFLFS